jgi:hypothetical protein
MAADFEPLIAAIAEPIKSTIPAWKNYAVRTSKVAAGRMKRMKEEGLDAKIVFNQGDFIIFCEENVFLRFHHRGQQIFALSVPNADQAVVAKINDSIARLNLTTIKNDDVLFIRLSEVVRRQLQKTKIPLLTTSYSHQITDSTLEIDFDLAKQVYGPTFFWKEPLDQWIQLAQHIVPATISGLPGSASVQLLTNTETISVIDINAIVTAAYGPLIDEADKLQRQPPDQLRIDNQEKFLRRIFDVSVVRENIVLLPNGGVAFEFCAGTKKMIAISASNLTEDEKSNIENFFERLELIPFEDFTHELFLVLKWHLQQFIPLHNELAESFVNSNEPDSELIAGTYAPLIIREFGENCSLNFWQTLSLLAIEEKKYRSPFVGEKIISIAQKLVTYDTINAENLFLSLSASHWKHAFLEIFRCLEAISYLGSMSALKATLGIAVSEHALLKAIEKDFSWGEKDRVSMKKLFALAPPSIFSNCSPASVPSIKNNFPATLVGQEFTEKLGNTIYSIRNSAVHQSDDARDDAHEKFNVTAECWPILTHMLFQLTDYLHTQFKLSIPTTSRA